MMGAATAADDKLVNETVSTSTNDVDALSQEVDSVDEEVSAAEATDLVANDANNSLNSNEILSARIDNSGNNEVLSESEDTGTITDLYKLIKLTKNGETLELTKNYKYSTGDEAYINGINLDKTITIDGNTFYIDLNQKSSLFQVNSFNTTIKNLNIINTNVTNLLSGAITWNANSGKIINCNFTNGTIVHNNKACSPFIYWLGSDGLIEDTSFKNVNLNTFSSFPTDGYYDIAAVSSEATNLKVRYCNFTNLLVCGGVSCTQSSYGNIIYGCEFSSNSGYQVGGRRSSFTVQNCYVHDCNTSSKLWENHLIPARGIYTVINTTIFNCRGNNIFAGDAQVYNCTNITRNTFTGLIHTQYASTSVIIDNCVIKNNSLYVSSSLNNFRIVDSTIKDNINFYISLSGSSIEISKNNISNNTISNSRNVYGVLMFSGNNINIQGNNITDNRNIRTSVVYLSKDDMSVNWDNNNISNNSVGVSCNKEFSPFTLVDESWVSPEGCSTNTGLSNSSTWDLNTALIHTKTGGTIHMLKGTYNSTSNLESFSNIIGEEDDVIINATLVVSSQVNVKNIKIQDHSIGIKSPNVEIINVTYINYTPSFRGDTSVRQNLYRSASACNIHFFNITIDGATVPTDHLALFAMESMPNVWMENITIKNVNIDKDIFLHSTCFGFTLKNLTIEKSNFKSLFSYYRSSVANPNADPTYGYTYKNLNGYDITVKGSTFETLYDIIYENDIIRDCSLNNITVINSNITGDDVFYNYINFNFNNISLINIDNTNDNLNIFKFTGSDLNVINLTVDNFTKSVNLLSSSDVVGIDLFKISNVNLTDSLTVNNNLNKFIFINVTGVNDDLLIINKSISLKDCVFDNVTGHILVNAPSVTISDSVFKNMNNSKLNGSAVLVKEDYCSLVNCNFTDNIGLYGAVYIYNTTVRPNLEMCNFTGNVAKGGVGGALYVPGEGKFTIAIDSNTTKTFGTISGLNDIHCTIDELLKTVYVQRGASGSGKLRSDPIDFAAGFAKLADNGELIFIKSGDVFDNTSSIRHNAVQKNITFKGNNTIINCVLFNVSSISNNVKLYNITFNSTRDTVITWFGIDGWIENCTFINCNAKVNGSSICVFGNNLTIINCTFKNNTANGDGAVGGALYIKSNDTSITDCRFYDNFASDAGSAIYLTNDLDNIVISDNKFYTSDYLGSGSGSVLEINGLSNSLISGNLFENGNVATGSVYLTGQYFKINLNKNNFTNNTAVNAGGLYITSIIDMGNFNINNNSFYNNTATTNGGAVYIDSNNIVLEDSYFFNNTATNSGGAIFVNGIGAVLNNNVFENNSAFNGGAVYIDASGAILSDCNFTGNNASFGGALYVNANDVWVYGSSFIANTANSTSNDRGSAIYVAKDVLFHMRNGILDKNYVYGGNDSHMYFGDISFSNISPDVVGTVLTSSPYQQYISNSSSFKYSTAFVTSGMVKGLGFSADTATSLSKVLDTGLEDNAVLYIVDHDFELNNLVKLSNLNVTVIGVNNTTIKRASGNENKYLFILQVFK